VLLPRNNLADCLDSALDCGGRVRAVKALDPFLRSCEFKLYPKGDACDP
jgi:hypothetical protein